MEKTFQTTTNREDIIADQLGGHYRWTPTYRLETQTGHNYHIVSDSGSTMEQLIQLCENKLLISAALSWIAAQLLKTLIDGLRNRHFNPHMLVGTGGMPSAHSAFVCGLATATAINYGPGSALFAVTAVVAAIVMYDAAGVRQAVDRQSEILTHILTHVPRTQDDFDRFLESLVGHTRLQVIMGGLLGIAVASLLH